MANTKQQLAVRAAQLRRWAKEPDPVAALAPARRGFRAKFEREIDALGVTDPADHARRVDQLVRAHMADLARKSATSRRRGAA
jgi:hypothetical protein